MFTTVCRDNASLMKMKTWLTVISEVHRIWWGNDYNLNVVTP